MQKPSFLFLLILSGLAALAAYEATSAEPAATAFIRFFGLGAFFLLCVSLLIGPLAVIDTKFAPLVEPRRAVGLAAFVFMAAHILLALSLYFSWSLSALLSITPIAIAIPGAIIISLVALASSDYATKLLGQGLWKGVQSLTYIAFVLLFIHFILQATGLFEKPGFSPFSNPAEIAMLLLGGATVLAQLYGFYLRRSRIQKTAQPSPSRPN